MFTYPLQRILRPDWIKIGMAVERAASSVAPIYALKGWKWVGSESSSGIPLDHEIAEELARVCRTMYERNEEFCRFGRLSVQRVQLDGYDSVIIALDLAEEDVSPVAEVEDVPCPRCLSWRERQTAGYRRGEGAYFSGDKHGDDDEGCPSRQDRV